MAAPNGTAAKSAPHAVAATADEIGPMPVPAAEDTLASIVVRLEALDKRVAAMAADVTATYMLVEQSRDSAATTMQSIIRGQGELRAALTAFLARQSEPAQVVIETVQRPAPVKAGPATSTPAEVLETIAQLHVTAYRTAGIADPANISPDVDAPRLASLLAEASGIKRGKLRELVTSHAFAPVAAFAASRGGEVTGRAAMRWLATIPNGASLSRFAQIAHGVVAASSLLPAVVS